MSGLEVYGTPMRRRYMARGVLSCAACVRLASVVVLLIAPFFLGFTSHSFWLRESVVYEQPNVVFKHQALVLARSSGPCMRSQLVSEERVRPCLTRVRSVDSNNDGRVDELDVRMKLPMQPGEQFQHISALLALEYSLEERARVVFETGAFIDYGSPIAGRALELDGNLELHQRQPLHYTGSFRTLYANDPLIPDGSGRSIVFEDIVRRYAARNISTAFAAPYPLWTPARAPASDPSLAAVESFELSLRMRIPTKQPVLYVPAVSEMLKFAWIQYLSMLVIVGVPLELCMQFLFRYQVVETAVVLDNLQHTKAHKF